MNRFLKKVMSIAVAASVIAVIVLGFAGCSKKEAGGGRSSLEFFSTKAENMATLQKLVDAFNAENPGVKVSLVSPASAGTVLRSRLTKNDIPDIIAIGGDPTYTEFQDAGMLLDLSGQPFIDKVQPTYQEILSAIHIDRSKKPFAVPYAANGSGVLYNKEIFTKYNVSIPKTFDELIAAANTFKKNGVNPFLLTFGDPWTILPAWNNMELASAPAGFKDALWNGSASFTGTHEDILRKYIQILDLCGNDMMGTSYNDGNVAFANGAAAMMINGNWAIPEFIKANPNMQVDLFPFPATNDPNKNRITSGVDVLLTVSAVTKNRDAALKFLDFMCRDENIQLYIDEQKAFSAIKGVSQNDPTVTGVKEVIAAGMVSDFPDHYYPAGFDLSAILSQFALNYVNRMPHEQNIREILTSCDTQYKALK
jgi:raffinose/stachyose/melibiose transport system substrate-binding protein